MTLGPGGPFQSRLRSESRPRYSESACAADSARKSSWWLVHAWRVSEGIAGQGAVPGRRRHVLLVACPAPGRDPTEARRRVVTRAGR